MVAMTPGRWRVAGVALFIRRDATTVSALMCRDFALLWA